MWRLAFIIACLVVPFRACAQNERIVYLYTYHNKPPFIVDRDREAGLYYDLANYWSKLRDDAEFVVVYLPRRRLDHIITNKGLDGVVMGAIPEWFDDPTETRFLWLPAYYEDRDEFVSLPQHPFEYQGPASLNDKIIAAVAGYYYQGINEAVATGRLKRIDTIGEKQVLELVDRGRADMGLVSLSVFNYLRSHGKTDQQFHLSQTPHDTFRRRAFVSQDNARLHQLVDSLIKQSLDDGTLQRLKRRYQ